MHTIDWVLVVLPILLVVGFAVYTQRYIKSVADFMAGGRCAGRYLICNARGEAASGVANTMSKFEVLMVSGFVLAFWEKVSIPVMLLVGISGFVIYRYRETRAMTLAQFFEMRYSRPFRLFMGFLGFFAGILNYGIFPAVASKFFVYFLGLPEMLAVAGYAVPTYVVIMAVYLTSAFTMMMAGGQITLMVTDCVEGILSHLIYMIIIVALLYMISWGEIVTVMTDTPQGKSLVDPFDAFEVADFNIWFIIMGLALGVYQTMAWQNQHGFNASARTPHEGRMGGVLGNWRTYARTLVVLVLGICALTFMRHSDFAQRSHQARETIARIGIDPGAAGAQSAAVESAVSGDPHSPKTIGSAEWFSSKETPQLQKQMFAPVALGHMLPPGLKGLFLVVMILGLFAGDGGHMHSWGSILVQDVVLPIMELRRAKKRPNAVGPIMSQRMHIWMLRLSVAFVGIFAFFFSILFTQTHYITLWWQITGGVFCAGAGSAIIGGLYWRRGTTAGAWAAVVTGATISFVGILCSSKMWPDIAALLQPTATAVAINLPPKFWLNGLQVNFVATLIAILAYIATSMLTSREAFNLDRLLHRGVYAVEADVTVTQRLPWRERLRLSRILGFDEKFSRMDKLVSGGIFWWSMALVGINFIVTLWNISAFYPASWPGHDWLIEHLHPWSKQAWANYWSVMGIWLPFTIAFATLIWFGIGGAKDLIAFFHALKHLKRDARDDGQVHDHQLPMDPTGSSPALPPQVRETPVGAGYREH